MGMYTATYNATSKPRGEQLGSGIALPQFYPANPPPSVEGERTPTPQGSSQSKPQRGREAAGLPNVTPCARSMSWVGTLHRGSPPCGRSCRADNQTTVRNSAHGRTEGVVGTEVGIA